MFESHPVLDGVTTHALDEPGETLSYTANGHVLGPTLPPGTCSSTVGVGPTETTRTATLDLLLAGLLDNASGGVNGTFQSVTDQVGFLRLSPTVVHALANSVIPSQGFYGPPPYTSPPSSSGSSWGDFWNAVTAIVTNPLGTLVSLGEGVWSYAVAAGVYFDQLAVEAVALAGQMLSRTVAAIVYVGHEIANAFEAFLNDVILPALNALLSPIVDPIKSLAQNYYSSLNSSLVAGNAQASANALGGPFFLLALGLATAVEIALALITPIDLGPSFLVTLLIGLLITIALKSAETSGIVNVLNGVTSFGGQIIRDVQDWVNTTSASADVKLPTRYNAAASVFSLMASMAVLPFSIGLIGHALGLTGEAAAGNPTLPIIAFVLAVITLGFHIVFEIDHVPVQLLILGGAFGGTALALTLRNLYKGVNTGLWRLMEEIDALVAGAALGVTVYEVLSE